MISSNFRDITGIYRNFLDIILYDVDIRKNSLIYPLPGGYQESFRIINSYAAFVSSDSVG